MLRGVIAIVAIVACVVSAEPPKPSITFRGQIVKVIDGDTIELEVVRRVRVRIQDCWAPETRTRDLDEKQRGLAAKAFLETLAFRQTAIVHVPMPSDRFGDATSMGRVIGDVWIGDDSIADVMIAAGHATRTKKRD